MRRALLALAAVPLLALVGCGDDGDTTTVEAVDLIRATSDAAADAGSAHLEMTVQGGAAEITATGRFDFGDQLGAMRMELPAPLDSTFEIVLDGTTSYLSADAFPFLPDLGAAWIRVDAEAVADQTGIDVDTMTGGAGSSNPADLLGALQAISEDGLDELGTEEVRGVETTHYAGRIDLDAAAERLEEDGGDAADEAALDRFRELYGGEPFPVEVWIDGEGLARRMVLSTPAEGQEVEVTVEMFDFGEPVDIQIPDEQDTIDLFEVLGELGEPSAGGD